MTKQNFLSRTVMQKYLERNFFKRRNTRKDSDEEMTIWQDEPENGTFTLQNGSYMELRATENEVSTFSEINNVKLVDLCFTTQWKFLYKGMLPALAGLPHHLEMERFFTSRKQITQEIHRALAYSPVPERSSYL